MNHFRSKGHLRSEPNVRESYNEPGHRLDAGQGKPVEGRETEPKTLAAKVAALVVGLMWYLTGEGLLVLLLLGTILSLLASLSSQSDVEDWRALGEYSILVVFLAAMCHITVQTS